MNDLETRNISDLATLQEGRRHQISSLPLTGFPVVAPLFNLVRVMDTNNCQVVVFVAALSCILRRNPPSDL